MKKYIHYCWFGDRPLPKLAKKCINSWKKFLPDYEIIRWSEDNVNLEECSFIKEAYQNKKWAFVADYARCRALKEMGGIYFDTDMEVTKDISHLFNCETFLGVEDTGFVAVGVWYEQNSNALLPTKLLDKYQSLKHFDIEKMHDLSIPKLISSILDNYGLKYGVQAIQKLDHNIMIYPREYFYPYSYDRTNNKFTDNTCMIHYYDASWIPLKDRIEINLVRKIGKSKTFKLLHYYRKIKDIIRKCIKLLLFPLVIIKRKREKQKLITQDYLKSIEKTIIDINKYHNANYIVLHNGSWFGVTSATKELFENTVDARELYRKEDIKRIGNCILKNNIKQVIFSAFSIGDKELAIYLKNKDNTLKIKSFWHGSHSQISDVYGWQRNMEIIDLHRKKVIDVMGSCKASLINFYKNEGFTPKFLTNKVTTDVIPEKKSNKIIIGLYAAKCDDWRKNMYSQMGAISLIENAVLDMVPLNEEAIRFAKTIGLKIQGEEKPLSREELLKRMSKNTVNLYVTYSECAPMLPLESFEMGVPCISGNNNHYFKNSELNDYIVINNEESPEEIKDKIKKCLDNKKKVMTLYQKFMTDNLKSAKKLVKEFIEM